jgi:S1-C subfamily serine protease
MRILAPLVVCVLAIVTPAQAAEPTPASPQQDPQRLAPYEVTASPLGYLGIKRGSARYDLFRLITFRSGPAFVRVDELDPDSPALAAGIKPGDWIMEINGRAIGKWSFSQLRHFGETVEVGQHILVDIYRPSDHSDIHAEVVVARKPKVAPAPT